MIFWKHDMKWNSFVHTGNCVLIDFNWKLQNIKWKGLNTFWSHCIFLLLYIPYIPFGSHRFPSVLSLSPAGPWWVRRGGLGPTAPQIRASSSGWWTAARALGPSGQSPGRAPPLLRHTDPRHHPAPGGGGGGWGNLEWGMDDETQDNVTFVMRQLIIEWLKGQ